MEERAIEEESDEGRGSKTNSWRNAKPIIVSLKLKKSCKNKYKFKCLLSLIAAFPTSQSGRTVRNC